MSSRVGTWLQAYGWRGGRAVMEGWLQRAFGMTDAAWRRHANPWSVWTRFLSLPLLAAAIWTRDWWGWWALAPTPMMV